MRRGVLIPLALAAFTAMVQPARAASFPMTTRAVNDERARSALVVDSGSKDSLATPRAEGEGSAGGALYSPFARATAEPVRQDIQTSRFKDMGGIDLLSTLVTLAGVGALIHLLRRARA